MKSLLREWLPPALVRVLSRPAPPGLCYEPGGWDAERFPGWNTASVLAHYKNEWPKMQKAAGTTAPLGRLLAADSVDANLLAVSFSYVVALAARGTSRLSLLDWGGGLGYYRALSEAAVPEVQIDYTCKDVPLLAEAGQQRNPAAHFLADNSFSARRYDLVVASGSLQYVECWEQEFIRLANCTDRYLFVTRLPTHNGAGHFLYSQHAYGSAWLTWSLNKAAFLDLASAHDLRLVRKFVVCDQTTEIAHAPSPSRQCGFLFQRSH